VVLFCLFYKTYFIEGFTPPNLNIVINSYKDNSISLDYLISSLKKCDNFKSCNVYVFIGGYYEDDNYNKSIEDNITYIKCNHNSIDFTGLIGILEFLPKTDEHYVYLHDTCVVGQNFINNINNIELDGVSSLRLKEFPSMNIGIYSNQLIHENKDILISLKNTEHDKTHHFKNIGVNMEDILFHNDVNNKLIQDRDHYIKTEGPYDFYGTGVKRIIEHYDLDLYKLKANWNIKDSYELKV